MAQVQTDIVVNYILRGTDEMAAVEKRYAQTQISTMGGVTTAAAAEANKQTTIFNNAATKQQEHSILSIKTVEQYRQDWAKQSTTKLLTYEKELSDQRTNLANQVKKDNFDANYLAAQHHKQEMSNISAELAALRQVSIERKEVLTGGMGGIIGQLGVGRNITNMFQTMQQMYGAPSRGLGGPAMVSGASGFGGFGTIGMGLGAIGGVSGAGMLGKDFFEAGERAAKVLETLRESYKGAGVEVANIGKEEAATNALATSLNGRWNVQSDRVREVSAVISTMGNVIGDRNRQITTLSVGIEELTKDFPNASMTAEQFAKILARDPDADTFVGRLRLSMPDLADKLKTATNAQDELRIATEYLTPKLKELDDRANSNEQATKRGAAAWAEIKREIGLFLVTGATPGLAALSMLSKVLMENAQVIGPLVVVIGGLTAAFTALVIVRKLSHSEEVIATANAIKETLARWAHVEAVSAETTALGADTVAQTTSAAATVASTEAVEAATAASATWGSILLALAGPIGIVAVATAAVVGVVIQHDQAIDDADKKVHDYNVTLAEHDSRLKGLIPDTEEYNTAVKNTALALDKVSASSIPAAKAQDAELARMQRFKDLATNPVNVDPVMAGFLGLQNSKASTTPSLESLDDFKTRLDKARSESNEDAIHITQIDQQLKASLGDPIALSIQRTQLVAQAKSDAAELNKYNAQLSGNRVALGMDDADSSGSNSKFQKAEDALKAHHAVIWDEAQRSITSDTALKENKFLSDKALLVSQYMLEVQYKQKTSDTLDAIAKLNEAHHQQQLKDGADASKKEADAEGKAWDAQLKQMAEHNKAVEELARKRVDRQREIDTKLQDQSDSTIQDKTKRETQQEQTRYEREQQKILDQADGTKGTHDQINQELELLEKDHWARIAQITDDGAGKSAKSVDKLSDSIKGLKGASSDLAKNWGEVVGPILAFGFDQIEKSQAQDQIHTTTKRQQPIPGIPGTGDWTQSQSIFNTSFPGDSSFFTGFHDTPGTLADSSGAGTIPVGNGKYMVIGQHNDRLVKDNPSPITFSSYKPDLSLPTKVQGGSTTSVATHREKHVDPIALQEAALKVHTDNVRDAQTARYLGTSVAAIRESRKLGDEKMLEAMKEIGIKLPIEVISGAAIGEGIAAGTEAFEGTQLGERILGHPLGRILSNGLEHAGGHISGNLLGSYVAEGSIPGFHDSPPLSQTGAPQIGGKYLVAGDGDDSLVKANYITQLPSMLTMAVTKGMNASDVAQHTQTIANVASGASSVYSSRRADPSSKSSDDLSDVMQFSSSLGNTFSAFSSAGKNQAGSGAKVMSSLSGLLGDKESQKFLTSLNGGKAPIAFGDTGFGAQGAAGQIGGMASTLGGIGSIIGMGTQPSPGMTHIADPYSAEARAWIAQAHKLRAPSVANILGNITSHAAPFANIIAPGSGALFSTAGNILGSYETGTPHVPKTGYYQLHEGERVVSAKENIQPVYRSSSSGGGQSGPMRLHPDDIRSLADAMSQRGIPIESFRTGYAQANNKVHTFD